MRLTCLLIATCALWGVGCQEVDSEEDASQMGERLVEEARLVHGSHALDRAVVRFTFRDAHFEVVRDGGQFQFTRSRTDSEGVAVRDVLDNQGIRQEREGAAVPLTEREAASLETAVNSVVYFALLPYNLADAAVQPRWAAIDTLRSRPYHRVEVTFQQEGGGRDWEDRFLYWFHERDGTMDFLAYDFHTGDGGTRFREAINVREVGGIRFADYLNYTADSQEKRARLEDYPHLLESERLTAVSTIELHEIEVDMR